MAVSNGMKFGYKQYGPDTIRPIIPIRVLTKDVSLRYEVLVDSGADFCLFHAEVGEAIGLDIKKGKLDTVSGVGGKISTFYWHTIEIETGGWKQSVKVGFLPNVGGRSAPYGIVGQKGFFEYFTIKFDYSKKEVEIKNKS